MLACTVTLPSFVVVSIFLLNTQRIAIVRKKWLAGERPRFQPIYRVMEDGTPFGSLRVKQYTRQITLFYNRMSCVMNLHVQAKRHHYYQHCQSCTTKVCKQAHTGHERCVYSTALVIKALLVRPQLLGYLALAWCLASTSLKTMTSRNCSLLWLASRRWF